MGASNVSEENESDHEFVVYPRRYLVLLSFSMSMFGWFLSTSRVLGATPAYARYHDTFNEFQAPPEWGIDAISVVNSAVLIFSYLFGAWCVEKFGLVMLTVGSFFIAIHSWMWYLAGENFQIVILSQVVGSVFGGCLATSLMTISNRWFGEKERSKATAVGVLVGIVGGGIGLLLGPMFATGPEFLLDLNLKSCILEDVEPDVVERFANTTTNQALECVDDLEYLVDSFCCYLPTDIEGLNFYLAIFPTFAFLFTLVTVRNKPPTPPSSGGMQKASAGSIFQGLKKIYKTERFIKISLSDFIVSGPALVLLATVSRIFPAAVLGYSFISAVTGLSVGVPLAIVVAHYLDRQKYYWSYTMFGYAIGTLLWIAATICIVSGTLAGAWAMLIVVALAIASYIAWQAVVYELKLEYAFDPLVSVEGWIVGTDRVVINLSSIVAVSAYPPERVGGAANTFIIGCFIMIMGCLPVLFINKKYRYKRKIYEEEKEKTPLTNITEM